MWAAYALATMVLVGVHPVFTHVPPNSLRSTIATFIPASLKRPARGPPACPVPTMIASYAFDINRSFLILLLRVGHQHCKAERRDRARFVAKGQLRVAKIVGFYHDLDSLSVSS